MTINMTHNEKMLFLFRGPDHDEEHLEPLDGLDRMRDIRGQDDDRAFFDLVRLSIDLDLRLAIQNKDRSVVGRGVFAQALTFVKGKERQRSCFFIQDLFADNRMLLIFHQFLDLKRRSDEISWRNG